MGLVVQLLQIRQGGLLLSPKITLGRRVTRVMARRPCPFFAMMPTASSR